MSTLGIILDICEGVTHLSNEKALKDHHHKEHENKIGTISKPPVENKSFLISICGIMYQSLHGQMPLLITDDNYNNTIA